MNEVRDQASFVDAFDVLFGRAYRLAYRLVGQPQIAEDLAAEALARSYAHWHRISALPHRDAWVLRVTVNLAMDALKRKPLPAMVASSGPTETESEENIVLRVALAAALQSLPRRQRQAVALRYLADLPADQVARALRMSSGSVKTHIHRGIASLRVRLGANFSEVIPRVESSA
jgi:RNA polymerase sigma-70 factor (ECF subfamily)